MFFFSCAGTSINPANLKTPAARTRFVVATYNAAYADHVRFSNLPNLKPEAKKLLNTKRRILIELADPSIGPITMVVDNYENGAPFTDALFNALLDKLLLMETGWYTSDSQAQVFELTPQSVFKDPKAQTEENLDKILKRSAQEAGLISDKPTAQISEILIGTLIELLRAGIHAVRVMLQQRGMDEEQLAADCVKVITTYKTLDPNSLKILE
jgi:hypothetical protein